MAKYFDLHLKTAYKGDIDKIEAQRFLNRRDAYYSKNGVKSLIMECCDIEPELKAIGDDSLPSPKYRASVIKYLETFFKEYDHPDYRKIDYSDYYQDRKLHKFPPIPTSEDKEYAKGFEKEMEIIEHYKNPRYKITDYDKALGFVFSVSDKGMHLQFLGTRNKLETIYMFQNCKRGIVFNFESHGDDRCDVHIRSYKTDGELPPMLRGNFYTVILLNILLNQTEKCEIDLHKIDKDKDSLKKKMSEFLYNEVNEKLILPSEMERSSAAIKDDIKRLSDFGYKVVEVPHKRTYRNYNDKTNITEIINEYYIPPFICKKDVRIIVNCIKALEDCSKSEKAELIEKFKNDVGYYRFSKDDTEEAPFPTPKNSSHPPKKLKSGHNGLVIYHTLRLVDRPLQVVPKHTDGLKSLAEKYYGKMRGDDKFSIGREAIADNTKALMAMGQRIKRSDAGYYFDTSDVLSRSDIDFIIKSIEQSETADKERSRLIEKVKKSFPIGEY